MCSPLTQRVSVDRASSPATSQNSGNVSQSRTAAGGHWYKPRAGVQGLGGLCHQVRRVGLGGGPVLRTCRRGAQPPRRHLHRRLPEQPHAGVVPPSVAAYPRGRPPEKRLDHLLVRSRRKRRKNDDDRADGGASAHATGRVVRNETRGTEKGMPGANVQLRENHNRHRRTTERMGRLYGRPHPRLPPRLGSQQRRDDRNSRRPIRVRQQRPPESRVGPEDYARTEGDLRIRPRRPPHDGNTRRSAAMAADLWRHTRRRGNRPAAERNPAGRQHSAMERRTAGVHSGANAFDEQPRDGYGAERHQRELEQRASRLRLPMGGLQHSR